MNEKFIHAFISKNQPQSAEPNKITRSRTHKKKKVIIEDDPVHYPDGAVTIDKGL